MPKGDGTIRCVACATQLEPSRFLPLFVHGVLLFVDHLGQQHGDGVAALRRHKAYLKPEGDFADESLSAPVEMTVSLLLGNHLFNDPSAEALTRRFPHGRTT